MSNARVVELMKNLFNIKISEGSITGLLAKASAYGEEGLPEKLRLNYFWLSLDDSKISFIYRDENSQEKYLSMDIGDTENSIQLEDILYYDDSTNIRFIISEDERYLYSGYNKKDISDNIRYYGVMIIDRNTEEKIYFRVGKNEWEFYKNFALSSDNQTLYGLYDGSLYTFSIENKKKITSMSKIVLNDKIYDFSYDPLTNTIFTMTKKGIKVIDTLSNKSIYYYATIERPKSISISPEGTKLGLGFNDSIEILNILEDKSLERHSFIGYPSATYGYKSISFKNNNLLFSDGYIIELSKEKEESE